MSRQPQQVHIWLYRENGRAEWEFAVFQRSDNPDCWQGVCGGLEEGETLEEGARRELFEEAGIAGPRPLYRLDSVSYVPACVFDKRRRRPGDRMSWSCRWPSSPCPVTGTSPSQASTRRSSGCPMRKPNVG